MIEFVSYTGSYPNLCRGVLTLIIDGEKAVFGYTFNYDQEKDEPNRYPSFWESGGSCGFTNNYANSYVNSGKWVLDEYELSDKYKKYAQELIDIFNENVEYGCCGGCL